MTSVSFSDKRPYSLFAVAHCWPGILLQCVYCLCSLQSKCERYWCDKMNEPFELKDRNFTVTMTGKKVHTEYEIRDLTIRFVSAQWGAWCYGTALPQLSYLHQTADSFAKPLKLKHFFFTAWPDHGVPQHPHSMVRFIQHVRKVFWDSPAPLVVHCRFAWVLVWLCGCGC